MIRAAVILFLTLMLGGCALAPYAPSSEERLARQVMFTVAERPAGSVASFGESEPVPRADIASVVGSILNLHQLRLVSQWSINALGLKAIVAEVKGPQRIERVVQSLRQDGRVESVERVKFYDLLTYNDPYFHMQSATVNGTNIENIHALTTGRNVSVAVIDTGIDRDHPELEGSIIMSRNFVSHDALAFDRDEHGTSVAGVIGSAANNDLGIVGLAPDAKLMAFKACSQDPQTRRTSCDSASLVKALVEVLKQQPDIVNLSLTGPHDPLIARLLGVADERGIIVIAAVDPKQRASFPADLDYVLGVSTPLVAGGELPAYALLAPGTDVLTTAPGATYAFRSGSSMASAHVTGIAALLKQKQPTLSTGQLVTHLRMTSRQRLNALPVVDICAAVSDLLGDPVCPGTGALSARDHPFIEAQASPARSNRWYK